MYVGVVRAPLGVITIKSLYSTVRAHNDVRALQVCITRACKTCKNMCT